jgi:hypothetical protein
VSGLLRQAEDILEIAERGNQDLAIVIDSLGGMRMLDPAGWSLSALAAESGAASVFKVERRAGALRIEGWEGGQRCLIQRPAQAASPLHDPQMGDGFGGRGKQRFQQVMDGGLVRSRFVGEHDADDLAILGHPNLVDQPVLGGVAGVLYSNSHDPVAERQHYSL